MQLLSSHIRSSGAQPRLLALLLLLWGLPVLGSAQSAGAEGIFHSAANYYIAGQQQQAMQAVQRGLRQYPTDKKLQALAQKLQQQEQQQNQQEQQQQQNSNNQQQQQQSDGGEQGKEEQQQEGEGDKKEQPGDQQKYDQQQQQQREGEDGQQQEAQPLDPQSETQKRLQEMNISPEKAKMILEAMRSNEIQYLQQKQRQPARRNRSDKPDW